MKFKLLEKILLNKIQKFFGFNRFLLIFILGLYIVNAHIFLPIIDKDEFFFLYKWALFDFTPREFVDDFTFDQGKTFLIRDQVKSSKEESGGGGV